MIIEEIVLHMFRQRVKMQAIKTVFSRLVHHITVKRKRRLSLMVVAGPIFGRREG